MSDGSPMNCSLSTLRMEDVVNGTLHRRVADVEQRLSAIEARTQAEPPKPEREPGWYPVGGYSGYPTCIWWSGRAWMTSDHPRALQMERQDFTVLGPRLDIPDEKAAP